MAEIEHVHARRVVANVSLSLDGRTNGSGGDFDMSWIAPHATTDQSRDHMVRVTRVASTALLGRKNYEGFGGFWPNVANDPDADPRDRAFAQWLDDVEKVVLSTTLTEAPWKNSRLERADPVEVVERLQHEDGDDIIVLASSSVIKRLLDADAIDRLSITLCPEIVGGGSRLLDDGVPATSWSLLESTPTDSGAVCLVYDRTR